MRMKLLAALILCIVATACGHKDALKVAGFWKVDSPADSRGKVLSQTMHISPAGDAFVVEMISVNPAVKLYETTELAATVHGGILYIPYRYNPSPIVYVPDRDALVGGFCNPSCVRTDAATHEATRVFGTTYKPPTLGDFWSK